MSSKHISSVHGASLKCKCEVKQNKLFKIVGRLVDATSCRQSIDFLGSLGFLECLQWTKVEYPNKVLSQRELRLELGVQKCVIAHTYENMPNCVLWFYLERKHASMPCIFAECVSLKSYICFVVEELKRGICAVQDNNSFGGHA